MDPSKDQDSQKHQRGTKTTKKEEDSIKNANHQETGRCFLLALLDLIEV